MFSYAADVYLGRFCSLSRAITQSCQDFSHALTVLDVTIKSPPLYIRYGLGPTVSNSLIHFRKPINLAEIKLFHLKTRVAFCEWINPRVQISKAHDLGAKRNIWFVYIR